MSTNAIPADPAAQLDLEEAAVERERLVERADLERDVVDPDGAGHAPCRLMQRVLRSAARSASVCSTLSWIGGESRRRRRKPDSCTTSTRTGLVAVTVAFRGRDETSAISPKKEPSPSVFSLRPLARTSTSPSTRTEELVPLPPSSISFVPAGKLSSSASVEISPSSFFAAAGEERHLAQQLELRVLAQSHASILSPLSAGPRDAMVEGRGDWVSHRAHEEEVDAQTFDSAHGGRRRELDRCDGRLGGKSPTS